MESAHEGGLSSQQSQLLGVVRGVRNRYRAKHLLRGAAIVVGGGWLAMAIAAYGMRLFKYSDSAVVGFRIAVVMAIVALIVRFLVLPLRSRFGDNQVALYLEEHETS